MPTGDPNCPPHICSCSAKRIYHLVVKAIDGLDGESGDDDDPPPPMMMMTTKAKAKKTRKMIKMTTRMLESRAILSTSPLVISLTLWRVNPVWRQPL